MEIGHRNDVTAEQRGWWDAICNETTVAMQGYCMPFVTPISHAISHTEGELEGTGSYLEFAGKRLLVSNEHVLRDWETRQFTHQFHGCEDVFRLRGAPIAMEKHPVDAAIWDITDEAWQLRSHQAAVIPSERLALRHAPVPGELLFFCGFPQQRSRFVFNTLANHATQLATQERRPPTVHDLHENYVLIGYSPEHARSVDPNGGVPLSNPPGLSGSLLWNTRRVECHQQNLPWSPDKAQVTGMLCRWDPPLSAVQAVRIEVLRNFLARQHGRLAGRIPLAEPSTLPEMGCLDTFR